MVHGRLKVIGVRFAVPLVVVLASAGLALADAGGGAPEGVGSVDGAGSSNGRGELATSVEHPASTGQEISELATTTDLEGWEKGAAISTLASGGMSQAGMHGPHATDAEPSEDHGGGPPSWAPASGHR
jgi:hypothetical protein